MASEKKPSRFMKKFNRQKEKFAHLLDSVNLKELGADKGVQPRQHSWQSPPSRHQSPLQATSLGGRSSRRRGSEGAETLGALAMGHS